MRAVFGEVFISRFQDIFFIFGKTIHDTIFLLSVCTRVCQYPVIQE
nr:MAG TPA: hypothetical protein [Caudoviricetes sp.]DAY99908.1 MAG TPA: hypothetical protein [Caudoviricetes sp.]DAZ76570.1 MAG TPA: hypothetical protein [Caudoviricetes sp.]